MNPIDYFSIFFTLPLTQKKFEVKMGKSQLSSKQRHIRDLIKNKQVAWLQIIKKVIGQMILRYEHIL